MVATIIMVTAAIAGVLLTVVSIVYVLKYRSNARLTYIDQHCIPLFQSIVQNVDGVEIRYKQKLIDPSLIMLQGSFANDGNLDINQSLVHKPLSIKLPNRYTWLEAKITRLSPGVQASYNIKDKSTLEFTWDLLKKNEFFSFNSLIKSPVSGGWTLVQQLSFSHRITNLGNIPKKRIEGSVLGKVMPMFIVTTLLAAAAVVLILSVVVFPTRQINYVLQEPNGKAVEVSIQAQRNNLLEIKGVRNKFLAQVKPEELLLKYKLSPLIVIKRLSFWAIYYGGLFIYLGMLWCIVEVLPRRAERRLMRIIKTERQ